MDHSLAALEAANRSAQRRFHEMLIAKVFGDPTAPETLAYVAAERVVDEVLGAIQRGQGLADGDHYLYPDEVSV